MLPCAAVAPLDVSVLDWAQQSVEDSDRSRLSAAMQILASERSCAALWAALGRLTTDPLLVFPAASALRFTRDGLLAAVQQAEEALLEVVVANPQSSHRALLHRWLGDDAGLLIEQRRQQPPALRAVQPAQWPRRSALEILQQLHAHGAELAEGLQGLGASHWPLTVERLQAARLALAEPGRLSGPAKQQRAALWSLLRAASATSLMSSGSHDAHPLQHALLRQALSPVLMDAAGAVAGGSVLTQHWGNILDRCDDLMSLSGAAQMERLLEILGEPSYSPVPKNK
jgi:hypothetical protein